MRRQAHWLGILLVSALGACDGEPTSSTSGIGVGGTGSGATSSSAQGAGADASSSTGPPCMPECASPTSCCGGVCVNEQNDVLNCGACGKNCPGPHAYCNAGVCEQAPCSQNPSPCQTGTFCCGAACCAFEQLCCGPSDNPTCVDGATCPP